MAPLSLDIVISFATYALPPLASLLCTVRKKNINHEVKSENMESQKKQKSDGNLWGGLILITIGAIFLIEKFVPALNFGDLWPLILVVVGVILISKNFQKQKD